MSCVYSLLNIKVYRLENSFIAVESSSLGSFVIFSIIFQHGTYYYSNRFCQFMRFIFSILLTFSFSTFYFLLVCCMPDSSLYFSLIICHPLIFWFLLFCFYCFSFAFLMIFKRSLLFHKMSLLLFLPYNFHAFCIIASDLIKDEIDDNKFSKTLAGSSFFVLVTRIVRQLYFNTILLFLYLKKDG